MNFRNGSVYASGANESAGVHFDELGHDSVHRSFGSIEEIVRLECEDENDLPIMRKGSDPLVEDREQSEDENASGSSKDGAKPEGVFLTIAQAALSHREEVERTSYGVPKEYCPVRPSIKEERLKADYVIDVIG